MNKRGQDLRTGYGYTIESFAGLQNKDIAFLYINTNIYIYIYIYIHIYIYTHTHTHIYIYIYIYIHTFKNNSLSFNYRKVKSFYNRFLRIFKNISLKRKHNFLK